MCVCESVSDRKREALDPKTRVIWVIFFINNISIDVWSVMIGRYLELFENMESKY